MCYAQPGPRCSAYAKNELKRAKKLYAETFANPDASDEKKGAAVTNFQTAVELFDSTNAGQKSLKRKIEETGDPDGLLQLRKDRGELVRKSQLEAYRKNQADRVEADGTPDCSSESSAAQSAAKEPDSEQEVPYSDEAVGSPEKVEVKGYGTFYRSDAYPHHSDIYFLRIQADEELSDEEVTRLAQLTGYAYRTTVRGESLGYPERDSKRSFVVHADTTKSRSDDVGYALAKFSHNLPQIAKTGSPVRKTDRAGAGTAGTRLVDGLGVDKGITVYYG